MSLPDVAPQTANSYSRLEWVGMAGIQANWRREDGLQIPVNISVGVNLVREQRGIHMSRLFSDVQNFFRNPHVGVRGIPALLQSCLQGQGDLSSRVQLVLDYQWPLLQSSLKSENVAERLYPFRAVFALNAEGELECALEWKILYSSTCPASAALSRSLVADAFASEAQNRTWHDSKELLEWTQAWLANKSVATPHAQRSSATLQILLQAKNFEQQNWFHNWSEDFWVQWAEKAVGTPVQSTVKRSDEQEFARLNAENLMFCEDAARRLQSALKQIPHIEGAHIRVEHFESLHAHNAVAQSQQGNVVKLFELLSSKS